MSSVGDGVGAVSYEHSCALGTGLVLVWRWISIRALLHGCARLGGNGAGLCPGGSARVNL